MPLLLAVAFFIALSGCTTDPVVNALKNEPLDDTDSLLWVKHIHLSKHFLASHKAYNNKLVFLVNMHVSANRYRFFVVDLKNDSVVGRGLVAHGVNSNAVQGRMVFSNVEGSNCTSLGKYRVGAAYQGRFGKAYRLYGLDTSNSNALQRAVVLHKWEGVPETETITPIGNSLGCPMVAPGFFSQLATHIDNSRQPILLYIFYE